MTKAKTFMEICKDWHPLTHEDGFLEAKKQVAEKIQGRIDVLEAKEASKEVITELKLLKDFIRNTLSYDKK